MLKSQTLGKVQLTLRNECIPKSFLRVMANLNINPFMPNGLFFINSLDRSVSNRRVYAEFLLSLSLL